MRVNFQTILAADYMAMFKPLLAIVPGERANVNREIRWAKENFEKQDRITWYLRLYRLSVAAEYALHKGSGADAPVPVTEEVRPWGQIDPDQVEHRPLPPEQQPIYKYLDKLMREYSAHSGVTVNAENVSKMVAGLTIPSDVTGVPLRRAKAFLDHFFGIPMQEIQDMVFGWETPQQLFDKLRAFEREFQQRENRKLLPKKDDSIFLQFGDGWAWWLLDRPSDTDEARCMGHCGNSPNSDSDTMQILSLRQPVKVGNKTYWEPHLTFILHSGGSLGEMKGRNNAKPVAKYHPYIIALLKDHRITSVNGGGYLPSHNFALADLTSEQREEIQEANPDMFTSLRDYYKQHGMNESLEKRIRAILGLTDAERDYEDDFVIKTWQSLEEFVDDVGDRSAREAFDVAMKDKSVGEGRYADADDIISMLETCQDEEIIYHIGLRCLYEAPRTMHNWYGDDFDPRDSEQVEQAVRDLFSDDNPPRLKIIQDLDRAWQWGLPDEDSVREDFFYALENAATDSSVTLDGGFVNQYITEEYAVRLAENLQKNPNHGFPSFSVSMTMPDNWDEWQEEQAMAGLEELFSKEPSRPVSEGQQRLFQEPATDEDAQRHGIRVSHILAGFGAHFLLATDYRPMFKALTSLNPNLQANIDFQIQWAKRELKKQDRITWYLRWYRLWTAQSSAKVSKDFADVADKYKKEMVAKGVDITNAGSILDLTGLKESLTHLYSLPIPAIQNRVLGYETPHALIDYFEEQEQEYNRAQRSMLRPRQHDQILLQFEDGWAWWLLPRAYCPDEARAMGHCGNEPSRDNKNLQILSLREPRERGNETYWEPHCTFILDKKNGTLGEMKGKQNNKPVERYHDYIMALLKLPMIKAIIGGGFLPSHNFSLKDLSEERREQLQQARPDLLAKTGNPEVERVLRQLDLGPDAWDEDEQRFIVGTWPTLHHFLSAEGDHDIRNAVDFVEEGKAETPSVDDLMEMLRNFTLGPAWRRNLAEYPREPRPDYIYNLGLRLMYDYKNEVRSWYPEGWYDPDDEDKVEQFLNDLTNNGETLKKQPTLKQIREGGALRQLLAVWYYTKPDPRNVEFELENSAMEYCMEELRSNKFDLELDWRNWEDPVKLLLPLSVASRVADEVEEGDDIPEWTQYLHPLMGDWTEVDPSYAEERAEEFFGTEPVPPKPKGQRRLFPEPSTDEIAKRRGITVSSLRNPLFQR